MFCAPRPPTNVFDPVTHLADRRAAGPRGHRRIHGEVLERAAGNSFNAAPRLSRAGSSAVCDPRRASGGVSPDPAQLVDTVLLLESTAIALGASTLTSECVRLARDADAALRACHRDPSAAARWAHLFHETLLAACPNAHLLELICREAADVRPSGPLPDLGPAEWSRVADDHDAILDMIVAGVPSRELERSLRDHASSSALCSSAPHRPVAPGR